MSALQLTLRQTLYQNRAFWRNPPAAFFTVLFPLMFLFIFNLLFGSDQIEGTDVSLSNFYVPAITAFAVISASFTNIAMGVSFSRDTGLLKRLRGTPLPSWSYMTSRVLHSIFIALLLTAVATIAGALLYDVDVPTTTMPAVIVSVLLGAMAFSALGLAITAAVPNAEAAPAIVNGVILPLLFISDIYIPDDQAPGWLRAVANVFPVKHFSEALQTPFDPRATGTGFEWGHLSVLIIWGAIGLALAVRYFSWEPRR